jgi:O-antigen/teichoic acid export membrane protein
VFLLLLNFVSRTIFIKHLGSTYLGINGLYTEILSLLSFAELGFGSAMIYAMYEPVAKNDREQIIKLLDFYKTIYRMVALVIAVLGSCFIPFLPSIVKGADWLTVSELRIYYIIFLTNNVIGYFVSYKYSFLNALQKNYIQTSIESVVSVICGVAQIISILLWNNFLMYLVINTAILVVSRFFIALYLDRKYPVLREKPKTRLDIKSKKSIFNDVKGLIVHQFSSVAIHSTDNIIISSLSELGVVAVGYISNYNLLINSVSGFITIIFNSFTSGFGNMVAESTTDNFRSAFKQVNFLNFWIYGFCSISFFVLIPPFISLWIGQSNLIDSVSFLLIVINFYMQGQSVIYSNARAAKGHFSMDKWWAFAQAIVNLIVSIIGVKLLGLVGVYIGTVTSRILYTLGRPISTYRFLFDKSCVEYFVTYFRYFIAVLIAGGVEVLITRQLLFVNDITVGKFALGCVIDLVIPNVIFLLLFWRTKEFQALRNRLSNILGVYRENAHLERG